MNKQIAVAAVSCVSIENLAAMETMTMRAIQAVAEQHHDTVLAIGAVRNILRAHDRLQAARHEYEDVIANASSMT